jgi:hypothetical protein
MKKSRFGFMPRPLVKAKGTGVMFPAAHELVLKAIMNGYSLNG